MSDLFAFIIKMPTMHRLACLRDDFIFFIYLYQRFAYRVDYSRVNEFGQGGDGPVPDVTPATIAGKGVAAAISEYNDRQLNAIDD